MILSQAELCLVDNMNSIGIGDNCLHDQRHTILNSNGLFGAYRRWSVKLASEIEVSINKVIDAYESNQDFYHILKEEINRYTFYIWVMILGMPGLFWAGVVFGYMTRVFIAKIHSFY